MRERSEKRLVRFVHFSHGQGVGGGIEVIDLVLFRAIIAVGSNWSITRGLPRCSRGLSNVLALA